MLHAFIGDCLTVKQNIPDLHTTYGFCCETLHQFWCETFTVIAWLTTYDLRLLLRNFAPVLVWNFYGDCLNDCVRLMAFAAKLCTSSGVKLLRWLPDWLHTTYGFCCETLHQFLCETFTVIAWLTAYDLWLLLRNLCTSSSVKLLRWLPDWLPTTYAAFAAKLCTSLLRWLSDGVALWLLGYRKNDWERSNSRWQAPTSAEKEHVISLALKSKGCCHSIFENTESIAFYTATERSLFALRR